MIVNTPRDFLVFLSVFICGVCIGAVFDIFRALRKAWPPGSGFLSFQDALFCAVAFFMFSHTVSTYADGDLRWYVFAGIFLGLMLYFFTLGKFVFLFFVKSFMIVNKALLAVLVFFKKLFSFISMPFLRSFGKLKQIYFSIKEKMTGYLEKNFKKIFTINKK